MTWENKLAEIQQILDFLVPPEKPFRWQELFASDPHLRRPVLMLLLGAALLLSGPYMVQLNDGAAAIITLLGLLLFTAGVVLFSLRTSRDVFRMYNSNHHFAEAIAESHKRSYGSIEKLLDHNTDALEAADVSYKNHLLILEGRYSFVLGGVRTTGIISWVSSLVPVYLVFSEKLPKLLAGSPLLLPICIALPLGFYLGALIAALPVQNNLDEVRRGKNMLELAVGLKKAQTAD